MRIPPIRELWPSRDVTQWNAARDRYWALIQPRNVALEEPMEHLDRGRIRQMSPDEWFTFLYEEYFRWKYTAANRYATTTSKLKQKANTQAGRKELHQIRDKILNIDPTDICASLEAQSCRDRGAS